MEKATQAVKELEYTKRIYQMEMQYRDEKEKNIALEAKLELTKIKGEAAAVEKGLKEEVAKKSVWYKQYWFTIPATTLVFVLSHGVLVP